MDGLDIQVLSSANDFISLFTKRLSGVNTMVANTPEEEGVEYAKLMYLEMIKSMVSGVVFGEREMSVHGYPGPHKKKVDPLNVEERKMGQDWAYVGDTMTGYARLDNVRDLITRVIDDNIQGGYIGKNIMLYIAAVRDVTSFIISHICEHYVAETGVWRGGSSIFARADSCTRSN